MSENFFLQQAPFVVPTTDGKLIEEHIGSVATGESNLSVAHMLHLRDGVNRIRIRNLMNTPSWCADANKLKLTGRQ